PKRCRRTTCSETPSSSRCAPPTRGSAPSPPPACKRPGKPRQPPPGPSCCSIARSANCDNCECQLTGGIDVITPRTTRLIRTVDLQAFQRAIATLVPADPAAARDCAVIVASHSAGEELRRTIGSLRPDIVTRDEFYTR